MQIKNAQSERNKLEITGNDIDDFIAEAKKVMEHPAEMLLNPTNIKQQQALFSLVFEKCLPMNKLLMEPRDSTWIFSLSTQSTKDKSRVVVPVGIEPTSMP